MLQASYKGHDAVVQLLAASGANPNLQDKVRFPSSPLWSFPRYCMWD
jgi:hypothetical protein